MSSVDILIWTLQISRSLLFVFIDVNLKYIHFFYSSYILFKCSFCRTNVLELVLFYDEMSYQQNEDVHAYPLTSFIGKKQLHLFL